MNVRYLTVAAIVVALLVAIGLWGMKMFMAPPDDLDLARTKATARGLYSVTIMPEAEPLKQGEMHNWVLTLKTAAGQPVEGASIAIDGGMPQHGHGLPTAPQATGYLGEGRYRIEGVRFNMSGWWELKFAISAAQGDDSATFNVVL
jgi:hypothetical protein